MHVHAERIKKAGIEHSVHSATIPDLVDTICTIIFQIRINKHIYAWFVYT
jgi:hypothetical protein